MVQPEPDGTGGAIRAALPLIRESETVVVLSGDHPVIGAEAIAALLEAHAGTGAAATMITIELEDPGAYGRVVRDPEGWVERVFEAKAAGDADAEELAIREINAGGYAFDAAPLAEALAGLSNDNPQGEYLLPDVFPAMREAGHKVAAHRTEDLAVTMGVNNRSELAEAEAEARRRILERHMLAGVTVVDPASTWIDADVEIAADARIEPGTSLRGRTEVGAGTVVGPLTTLIDTGLGAGVEVPHSYLVECEVARRLPGRPLRLPAPRRQARARRQGGHLRRGQELGGRRGREDPAPLLRRRRRRRPAEQPRRRHDHRQLRRIPQAPHCDRRRRAHRC